MTASLATLRITSAREAGVCAISRHASIGAACAIVPHSFQLYRNFPSDVSTFTI
ncbi:MAG: hypothetical protein Ct9H300mP19_20480 [Dehalococcoidia bacterium]|nr:MAG: hypothetical protein Ct9H300mP19_20480 [Dehalococcoidia bacterium]